MKVASLAGSNSCVPFPLHPPPQALEGPCIRPPPHPNLPSLLHHILAIAAMAFTSALPSGQSDGQVRNDCRVRLTPVTSASSCWSSCCHWHFGLFTPKTDRTEYVRRRGRVSEVKSLPGECSGLMQSKPRGASSEGLNRCGLALPWQQWISEIQIVPQNLQMILSWENGGCFNRFQFRWNESSQHLLHTPNQLNGPSRADLHQPFPVQFPLHFQSHLIQN